MSEAQPTWIGHTLSGRYKIESLLGSSGMASVYKAIDLQLKRRVAVKLIHSDLAQQPEFVQRFEREASALKKLHHPNIVPVYDFNNDRGVYYMVLGYVPGQNLEQVLKALKKANMRMPLLKALHIMITLCDALDYAHRQNIIHCNLKPSNILFDKKRHPYLVDFGMAGMVESTHTMTVVSTPTYISPEQARGEQDLDKRSDIYSLGVVFYEMVGGRPPFEGSLRRLKFKHLDEPVPDIRKYNKKTPDALVAVIEKALAKNPEQRFQSAREMVAALCAINLQATGGVGTTSPPKRGDSPPPPTRQNQKVWGIGFLLLAVAIVAVIFSAILRSLSGGFESSTSGPATITVTEVPDNENVTVVADEPEGTSTNATGAPQAASTIVSTTADFRLGYTDRGMNCPLITEIIALILKQEEGVNVESLAYDSADELFAALAQRDVDLTLCYIDPDDRPQIKKRLGDIRQIGSHYWNDGPRKLQIWANGSAKVDLRDKMPCIIHLFEELNLMGLSFQEDNPKAWLQNYGNEIKNSMNCVP